MEMLHSIWQTDDYHLLVLDTPPTANAVDFLEAPGKMVNAVKSPAVALFIKAYQQTGRLSLNVLSQSVSYIVRRLALFLGRQFLDDIAGFLSDLSGLMGTLQQRADNVQQMLRRPDAAFVIVTSPAPAAIDEAIHMFDLLRASQMRPAAFIINKIHPLDSTDFSRQQLEQVLSHSLGPQGDQAEAPAPDQVSRLADAVHNSHVRMRAMARADEAEVSRLRAHCGADLPYVRVPLFDDDIVDIAGLVKLGDYLV